MSKYPPPKTTGLEWLQHSMVAFNGSGYADRDSGEGFLKSYRQYNSWKKREDAVVLVDTFYHAVLPLAQHLVDNSDGPGRPPSQKSLRKFNEFRGEQNQATLT